MFRAIVEFEAKKDVKFTKKKRHSKIHRNPNKGSEIKDRKCKSSQFINLLTAMFTFRCKFLFSPQLLRTTYVHMQREREEKNTPAAHLNLFGKVELAGMFFLYVNLG